MGQLPAAEINVKVRKLLARVRLDECAAGYPQQLSGGQQQRITLAQALVFDPELVLMAEPLGVLDKQLREHMQLEIKYIHRKLGIHRYFRYPRSERGTDHVRPHHCLQPGDHPADRQPGGTLRTASELIRRQSHW